MKQKKPIKIKATKRETSPKTLESVFNSHDLDPDDITDVTTKMSEYLSTFLVIGYTHNNKRITFYKSAGDLSLDALQQSLVNTLQSGILQKTPTRVDED